MKLRKEFLSETKVQINDKITASIGYGGNSGIIEFRDLIIIIDTKMDSKANDFYNSIKNRLEGKTVYLINTHLHADHTDGNYLFNAEWFDHFFIFFYIIYCMNVWFH